MDSTFFGDIASPPKPLTVLLEEVARLERIGRADEAERALRGILEADPLQRDANERLFDLLLGTDRLSELEARARALIDRDHKLAFAWIFLCRALLNGGQDAVAACETAVEVARDDPQAYDCLGVALRRAGRHEEAEVSLRRALALRPDSASTHLRLAELLRDMGRMQDAVEALRAAIGLDPQLIQARCNLALILTAMGRHDESQRLLKQLVDEAPDFVPAHSALASMHLDRREWVQAEAATRRVLELAPELAGAHFDLANILFVQLRDAEGLTHLDEAVRLEPNNGIFRSCRVVRTLPLVPRTPEEADEAVGAFDSALREYSAWRASCRDAGAAVTLDTISMVPFLLAYRDGNHVDLLSQFADEMGPRRAFTGPRYSPVRPRVRLGIISQHFRRHSVWDVISKGILAQLDRSRFEVYLYHVGAQEDRETAFAKSNCDRWLDNKSVFGAPRWAAAIEKDRLDVLFYPELGMDLTTYLIARERLAPVQAVGWGHPITSGLSTMDLFLSGDLFEPPEAQSHYRERLIRLPGTGACTTSLVLSDDPPKALLDDLAARPGPTFLVPQMPFKFDPRFDRLLARTVQSVGPCTVVIPVDAGHDAATEILAARLGMALRSTGSDPDAVLKLVPWLRQSQFNALLDASDVMLDCPFSGYTTAWLAVHRGTPVVSMTGPCLRHRLVTGLHRKMGITDTIVDSQEAYVRVAATLALEGRGSAAGQARRQAIRAAAPSTDGDLAVVRAIELAFLQALDERRLLWRTRRP